MQEKTVRNLCSPAASSSSLSLVSFTWNKNRCWRWKRKYCLLIIILSWLSSFPLFLLNAVHVCVINKFATNSCVIRFWPKRETHRSRLPSSCKEDEYQRSRHMSLEKTMVFLFIITLTSSPEKEEVEEDMSWRRKSRKVREEEILTRRMHDASWEMPLFPWMQRDKKRQETCKSLGFSRQETSFCTTDVMSWCLLTLFWLNHSLDVSCLYVYHFV